jgi:hypothetical protein
MMTHEF